MDGGEEVLGGARVPTRSTARGLFEAAWKRAECNQHIDQALNNARYYELGGGYSLGMVLCWLGPDSESQILFLVAPKTGGRPQLLRLQDGATRNSCPPTALDGRVSSRNENDRQLSRYSGSGICGAAGEWTWTGTEFTMTGYWDKPDCNDEREFDRGDRFRVFPPKK